MARIFVPKMCCGGAKIEWHSAAVALMRWRENLAEKRRGGAVAQRFKRWRTSRSRELKKVARAQNCKFECLCILLLGEEVALLTKAKFCLSVLGREVILWVSAAILVVKSLQLAE